MSERVVKPPIFKPPKLKLKQLDKNVFIHYKRCK